PVRMIRDERLELADELGVPAERQVGVDPLLQRYQPQILQTPGLRTRERLVGELCERRPPPQRERLAEQARRTSRIGASRLGDEPLEAQQVDRLGIQLEQVP